MNIIVYALYVVPSTKRLLGHTGSNIYSDDHNDDVDDYDDDDDYGTLLFRRRNTARLICSYSMYFYPTLSTIATSCSPPFQAV